jgi:cytochrome c oxidase subunit 2
MFLANIPFLPEQASAQAVRYDYLFWFISIVTGAGTVLVYVLLAYLCAMYRRRGPHDVTPRILGSHKLELFWTVTPLITFLVFFAWGVIVWDETMNPPPDAPEIYVVGKQWMWKIQHPDGTREINELHLLVNQPVKITLTSEDVIHSFGIPAFRDKIDAVPGRYVTTWYHPTKPGRYRLYCDQLCGIGHSQMIGWVHVMEKADYEAWMDGKRPGSGPTDGSLAWQGRQLFLKLQCSNCHYVGGRAPILEGIWDKYVPIKGGGMKKVDEGYVAESILNPRAKVHEGWEPIMPTYRGQLKDDSLGLSEQEVLIRLIAFIKTLGRGQTPDRTEQFTPPVGAPTKSPSDTPTTPEGGSPKP